MVPVPMLLRALARRTGVAMLLCAVAAALIPAVAAAQPVGAVSIQSGGFGHGIGLSQYGALGYAQHGKSYQYILAHYYQGTGLGQTDPDRLVRVLLSGAGQPTFSGADAVVGRSTRLNPAISYTVRPNADGTLMLVWHGVRRHKPVLRRVGPFTAPLTVTGAGPLLFAGKGSYHGSFSFRRAGGSGVETVESLALDDYVRGVVAAEAPSSWPSQALEAQAVAARTYAITTDAGGGDFDVYPDTRSQMYGGISAETTATDAAVDATRGQVVTSRGVPVVTYFFSSSGGHTESVQNEWAGTAAEPWLVGVPDPYDAAGRQNPHHRVTYLFSLAAAARRLHGLFSGSLEGIRVLRHGVSPRVILAEVLGTRGSRRVSGKELQRRFGLLTDWEVFTTLSAAPGPAPSGNGSGGSAAAAAAAVTSAARAAARAQTQAMTALVPLIDTMLVQAITGLHGAVIPAPAGARIEVQLRERGRWQTVARPHLGSGGDFDLPLPGRGTYRVRYGTLSSPSIAVG